MVIIKHYSKTDNSTYGSGIYFHEEAKKCDDIFCNAFKHTIEQIRNERAGNMLREIAHSIFSSENPEYTARAFSCAPAMLRLLKRIASPEEICSMREIYRLIDYINGKDCD